MSLQSTTAGDPCDRCGGWHYFGYCPVNQGWTWTTPTLTFPQPLRLSDEDVERIARRVAELVKPKRKRKTKKEQA